MSSLVYVIIGLATGGFLAALVFFVARRASSRPDGGSEVQAELIRRLDLLDRGLRDEFSRNREEGASAAKSQREELGKSLEGVRAIVDVRLKELQQDNAKQIDKMRATVDEKLQGTLEKRLGESFKLVSERLEQVHKGLGAMQQLASDVGGLQKVLSNVKMRGGWGEVQLGNLLEQVLTADQFARNVKTRDEGGEHVDFAIKLPGDENGAPVWLPIDAKFPTEDYQRLLAAQDKGDVVAIDDAMRSLETQLNCRVIFAGPTTLAALLNSLQMGFRTLAIQKRSSEVWNLLAAVKTEFGKFGEALSAVKDKLDQAARHVDNVAVRSRAITKKLRDVEELPSNPQPLLKDLLGDSNDAE